VPRSAVPADEVDQLNEDSCESIQPGAYLCVPNELVEMQTPPRCNAYSWLFGTYNGVCLSDCINFDGLEIVLDQGSCQGGFTCAPCVDPTTGQPTGAPGC
jgi:hypothetical protein